MTPRRLSYVMVTLLALILRLVTLNQFTGHIDEPASLLAIKRVSDIGYPLYPSGVLYLQGAVFSYIAAPLAWFFDDSSLLRASQYLYLLLALSLIPLTMKLVTLISDRTWVAVFVGLLIASDPNLIIWSVTLRPYGLLAAEVVALLLLFVLLLRDGADARLPVGRVVVWLPVLVAIGTFTHIGFWLAMPPLALIAALVWKTSLTGPNRAILVSGAVSGLPLLAFLLLGRLVGTGSGTAGGNLGGSFVGSHLFSLERLLDTPEIRWSLWTGNFFEGNLFRIVPYLIALASGVLVYAVLAPATGSAERWRARAIGTLVLVHWFVIVAAAVLVSSDPDPRYLNQVLPIGYTLVGLAAWTLWRVSLHHRGITLRIVQACVVVVLIVPMLIHTGTAASWRIDFPGGSADYWEATRWAAEHRTSGQMVITALPPATFFWFSEDEYGDLVFLAGPADNQRARRYIKPNLNGEPGDYWLGLNSIGSTEQLCSTLERHAGNALIVVDRVRLSASWALRGQFERIIRGSAIEVHQGRNGILVLSVVEIDRWADPARDECGF